MAGVAVVPLHAQQQSQAQASGDVEAVPTESAVASNIPPSSNAVSATTARPDHNRDFVIVERDLEDPAAPVVLEAQDRQPASVPVTLRVVTARVIDGMPGGRVHYPPRFKALCAVVLGLSLTWVGNYLLSVLPTIEAHHNSPCKYNDNQLTYNAKMLFVYFAWFAIARSSLFVPCIAARVAQVQLRTHGFCRTYCIHLVLRDGPLYIFVVGSLLFWFYLMESPNCQRNSPKLYRTLNLYAIYSCLVSIFCLVLAYWHNKLLCEATRDVFEREDRSAPPDTLQRLQTVTFDPAKFGDDDGKLYSSECTICLLTWEADDLIKVTPCGHAFHEECLGGWLQTARTCPVCRRDLTKGTSGTQTAAETLGSAAITTPVVATPTVGTTTADVPGAAFPISPDQTTANDVEADGAP